MSEFIKTKIAYAVALLAVAFTLRPLIDEIGSLGFYLIGYQITVMHAYFTFFVVLALAVYIYGLEYISESYTNYLEPPGNWLYGLAILVPPAYIVLYALVAISNWALEWFDLIDFSQIATGVISALIGAITALSGKRIRDALRRADRASSAKEAERAEVSSIARVDELLRSGYHDLAVLECRKLIEYALRKYMFDSDVTPSRSFANNLKTALDRKLIPSDLEPAIRHVQLLGNQAAHSTEQMSKEIAESAVDSTRTIISEISRLHFEKWATSALTYRRGKGGVTWHWCTNCSTWPSAEFEERDSRPTSGELCNECREKERAGNCQQ